MNAADRERILREIRTIVSRISESIKSSASELIESRRDWDGARWWRQARAAAGGPPGPVELRASSLPEGAARGYSLWEIGAKGPVSWPKWQDVTQGQLEVIPVVGAAKHHQFALQLEEKGNFVETVGEGVTSDVRHDGGYWRMRSETTMRWSDSRIETTRQRTGMKAFELKM